MIFLTPEQLREVEYLINQSRAGVHHLFEPNEIKKAFALKHIPTDTKYLEYVKELFFKFISQETLEKKKTFFRELPDKDRSLIIRTYFNIVDNELIERQTFLI